MVRVEWAMLCDLAYFDAYRNLCLIGVQTQPVPTFSIGTRRLAIAARVPGLRPNPQVLVAMSTPDRLSGAAAVCEHLQVDAVGDDLVIAIGGVPLIRDGVYRFEVSVSAQPPIEFDLPIIIAARKSPLYLTAEGYRGANDVELG